MSPVRVEALADLGAVRDQLAALVRDFDAQVLRGREAMTAVEQFAELERLAVVGKLSAAARADECGAWKSTSHRSAASWLASKSGTSTGAAADGLSTVGRLAACPGTDEAFRAGRLSVSQADAVSRAVVEAPDAESALLDLAGREDLRTLRAEALRVRHRGEDAERKHRRQRARRRTHTFTDLEGMSAVDSRFTPEVGARAWAALDFYTDRAFKRAKAEGRHEDLAAYRADAMADIFDLALRLAGIDLPAAATTAPASDSTATTDEASPTLGLDRTDRPMQVAPDFDPTVLLRSSKRWSMAKVIVRIDHAALVRGWVEGDEVAEIAGVGPVPVSVVREMIAGDAFLAAIVTRGTDVLNVAHLGRQANAYQRTGLQWCQSTCRVLGCSNPRLQIDHRHDWHKNRETKLDNLDGLCAFHHGLKTFEGWALVEVASRSRCNTRRGRRFLQELATHEGDLRPCQDEYRPPSGSVPRSTGCSGRDVTSPRSSRR